MRRGLFVGPLCLAAIVLSGCMASIPICPDAGLAAYEREAPIGEQSRDEEIKEFADKGWSNITIHHDGGGSFLGQPLPLIRGECPANAPPGRKA